MNISLKMVKEKLLTFDALVMLLTGLWIFMIPFGKGEKVPVMLLAVIGVFRLIQTKGRCAKTDAAKAFLLLLALYLIPIALSMTDAPAVKNPIKVFSIGCGCGLAGIAIISATAKQKILERITLILAVVVSFWLLDAGFQAVFGCDIFGMNWEEGRLSGPFLKKTQMGYYSGPLSALLLMFALQKKWKPILLWALFIFTSVIVLLNNSRGGWVMYGVVAVVFVWQAFIAPRKHKVLICTGLVTLGIALLTGLYFSSDNIRTRADQTLLVLNGNKQDIDAALTYRLQIWEAAWSAYLAHPVNGSGARNFRVVGAQYWPKDYDHIDVNTSYPHQYILEYMVGTGLIGLAGLIVSIGLCIRWWRQASAQQKGLAAGYGLTLVALYFPLSTHKAYYSSEMAISIWVIIALYCATILNREEDVDNGEMS